MTVTDEALRQIAAEYTREAGVRQLERLIAKVFRKVATRLASGTEAPIVTSTCRARVPAAGRGSRRTSRAHGGAGRRDRPGRDRAGGDVLFIEATAPPRARPGSP